MTLSTLVGRQRLRARRPLLLLTTILGAGVAMPAMAQLAPPAPVRQSVDANGVDLFLGTLNVDAPKLTMGQGEPQGIAYYRLNRGGAWTDNTIATLTLNAGVITVGLGEVSDSFTVSGTTYIATQGNGATLSFDSSANVYTYMSSDGTLIHFSKSMASPAPYYAGEGRVTDIVRPSGVKLTFAYTSAPYCTVNVAGTTDTCAQTATAYRVTNVHNSYGYQLAFTYSSDTLNASYVDATAVAAWSSVTGTVATNLGARSGTGQYTASQSFGVTTSGSTSSYQVTDALGRVTQYRSGTYPVMGMTLPGSTAEDVTVGYDASGKVSSVTTPAGVTQYAFSDAAGVRTTTVTDAASHATTYTFNITSQRMTSMTDALSHTTTWTYDTSGRLLRSTKPEGNYVELTYQSATRPNVIQTRAAAKPGSGLADINTYASFDATCTNPVTCNQPNTTTDARGNITSYTYDPTHGGVLSVTQPAPTTGAVQPKTTYSYTQMQAYFQSSPTSRWLPSGEFVWNLTGTSTCQTTASCAGTADEVKTTTNYGPQVSGTGNNLLPVSVTTGAGDGSLTATTTYAYDAIGNRISVDGPLDGTADTTVYAYDADRELTQVTTPNPDGAAIRKRLATVYHYMANGLIDTTSSGALTGGNAFGALQYTLTTYDAARRKVSDTLESSANTIYSVTQYSYDTAGRLECTAQRMNSATWSSLPASACTLGTTGSAGADRISKSTYDAADRVTKTQSAYGTADQADDETTSYNTNGTVATQADADGNLTTYSYDGFDRLTKTQYPVSSGTGSSTTDYELLGYDAGSNIVSRRLRDGNSITYAFDALDRLTAKTLPAINNSANPTFAYDNLGRVTQANVSNANYTANLSFAYDALGRKISETSTPGGTKTLAYDLAGHRTRLTWSDGFYVTYDYDLLGYVTAIRENGATTGTGVLASYAFDQYSRRTGVTFGNGTSASYAYDGVSRLSTLTQNLAGTAQDVTLAFTYNPASQIQAKTRSNDAYAFTQNVNVNRAYGVNGLNQFNSAGAVTFGYDGRGNLTSSGTDTYAYSAENMLTSANGQRFDYDAQSRLIYSQGSSTRFDYDGSDLLTEYNLSGAITRRFVPGPGDDQTIVWYEGAGQTNQRWLHTDQQGSVIAVSDNTGASLATNSYDEYGIPASGNLGRFQYTGQAWLPELGMYNYKARIYSPTLGRFLQTDPIGYDDGMNWYNYVGGDPVNKVDPSGMAQYCISHYDGRVANSYVEGYAPYYSNGYVGYSSDTCYYVPDYGNNYPSSQQSYGYKPAPVPTPKPAAKPTPQNKFVIKHGRPPNAIQCKAAGVSFLAPRGLFNPPAITAAGRTYGIMGALSSVGHYGSYDFQRVKSGSNTTFYSQYTPAANVAVGLYLGGAGYSRGMASTISDTFAANASSNGATAEQAKFRNLGWDLAHGASLQCRM